MMNLPIATILENVGQLIAVICVIGGLLIALVVPVAAIYFQYRRQQLWHETARLALEKDKPLPAMPAPTPQPANDVRSGLILIAVGVGLTFFLYYSGLRYLGAIPGSIGVALLLYGLFNARSGRGVPRS